MLHATIGAVAARRPIPDASNLRDLGGHRTTTGATVKWRTLYRSNELSRLSDESVRALAAIGIRTICDFRNEKERAAAPTRLPPGDALQTHLMPIGVKSQLGSVLSTSGVTESDVRQALQAIYRSFALDYAPAYQALFDRLIESHHYPLVFHCSAGKDRTGVAAALILTALGVPKDAVFEDYLLTNDYWSAPAHILPGSSGEARKAALAAHPEYLMAAFDAIDQSYGSIDRYLVEAMGLTPQRRAQLEANLLEQSV